MKWLQIFSIIALIIASEIEAQNWIKKSPFPTGENLNSVFFTTNSIGYAVGSAGTIIKTTDGGNSWFFLTSGTTANLQSVYFPSINIGFAVGDAGIILKTTDSGLSWNRQRAVVTGLSSTYFVNDSVGYIVGVGGLIKTLDGGNKWFDPALIDPNTQLPNPSTQIKSGPLTAVSFLDTSIGFCVSKYGWIYKTTDGGKTWQSKKVSNLTPSISDDHAKVFSFDFSNPSKGFVAGWESPIYSTLDTGKTWVEHTSPGQLLSISSISNWVSVGSLGTILPFESKYYSQSIKSYDTTITLNSVNFPRNSDTGYAVGQNGLILKIIKSPRINSALKSKGTVGALQYVFSLDSNISYAVGNNGLIRKTIDGWKSWIDLPSGTNKNLEFAVFIDPYEGYVIATDGTIFHTVNSGDIWTHSTISSTGNPIASGASLRSKINRSYGINCPRSNLNVTLPSPMTTPIQWGVISVYFLTTDTIFVMGYDLTLPSSSQGKIARSTDGGKTWKIQPFDIKEGIGHSMYFVNSKLGFVMGYNGNYLKTIDGGTTWMSKISSTLMNYRVNSVAFSNAITGYAVGPLGTISKTTDGGDTWAFESSGVNQELLSIQFTSDNAGYIVGESGTILKVILTQNPVYLKRTNLKNSSIKISGDFLSTLKFEVFDLPVGRIDVSLASILGKIVFKKSVSFSSGSSKISWADISSNGPPPLGGIYTLHLKYNIGNHQTQKELTKLILVHK